MHACQCFTFKKFQINQINAPSGHRPPFPVILGPIRSSSIAAGDFNHMQQLAVYRHRHNNIRRFCWYSFSCFSWRRLSCHQPDAAHHMLRSGLHEPACCCILGCSRRPNVRQQWRWSRFSNKCRFSICRLWNWSVSDIVRAMRAVPCRIIQFSTWFSPVLSLPHRQLQQYYRCFLCCNVPPVPRKHIRQYVRCNRLRILQTLPRWHQFCR